MEQQHAPANRRILEVIVTSSEEAQIAEEGGADRLEVVQSLAEGGLTPRLDVVRQILASVSIPTRIMLRERNEMFIAGKEEQVRLVHAAQCFAALPVEGLVLGFLKGRQVDSETIDAICSSAAQCRMTFHRAFESVYSPSESIIRLKRFPQIDRILVRLADEEGKPHINDLVQWQNMALPEIQLIAGIGLKESHIFRLTTKTNINEIHVGRLVRESQTADGRLNREKIAKLKSMWR